MSRRFRFFQPGSPRRSNRTATTRTRLHSESLESRNLLAVFAVTNGFDGVPGDLRSAVLAANANPGPDTIQLQVNNVQLVLGDILISDAVDINGATAITGHVDIHAAPNSRIFTVDDSAPAQQAVSLNELTLSGGDVGFPGGGAIFNREDLRILNSTITGNTATIGGGILNEFARVYMRNTQVDVNYASYEGGGIFNIGGVLEMSDSAVRANRVSNTNGSWTFGGGIRNLGQATATLENSQVLGNAVYGSNGGRAFGGGIATMLESAVHLINSDVGDNYATHQGGGLFVVDNSSMMIEQQSSVFGNIAGEAGGGIYLLRCTGDVVDSTITGNATERRGGGISAGNDVVLNVTNSDVLTNTTNFFSPDGSGGGAYFSGFGQANGPVVTIANSRIRGNNVDPNGSPGGEFGGGITARYGTRLYLDSTEISDNKASISGGGIYASDGFTPAAPEIHIQGSQLSGNSSGSLGGGITMAGGYLQLQTTTVDQNTAVERGGGLFLTGLGSPSALDAQLLDSVISGNVADLEGGGVAAGPNMTLAIDRSRVTSNHTFGKGGGLYLTALGLAGNPHVSSITDSTISDNVARYIAANPTYASGGGIWAGPAVDVSVQATTISDNRAGRLGGGMMIDYATFDVRSSTVAANSAGMDGGGAYVRNSDGLFEQDTWSQNGASENGGALHLYSNGSNQVSIQFNTISLNQADRDQNGSGVGGGVYVDDPPINPVQTRLSNSVVADNFAGTILALPHNDDLHDGPGLAGLTPIDVDYSLIGSRKGTLLAAAHPDANGNFVGTALTPVDPVLDTLTNNGGPTSTMLPQPGSPAIDAGDPLFGGIPAFDQRGAPYARIFNGRVDMGAVEVPPSLPTPDLNHDGLADINDINLLTNAIVNMTYVSGFDMNGDGILDVVDIERWLCKAGSWNLGPNLSYRFGDANLDGNVDGQDFIVWNSYKFSAQSDWSSADFNADGMIDGVDFIAWNANKFQGPFPCVPVPIVAGGNGRVQPTDFQACASSPLANRQAAARTEVQASSLISQTSREPAAPPREVAVQFAPQLQKAAPDRDDHWSAPPQEKILDLVFAGLA